MAKAKDTTTTEPRKRGSVPNAAQAPQALRTVAGKYQVKGQLNVPFLKLNAGDELAFEIDTVRLQQMADKKKPPATVLRSVDLETGQIMDVIAPTVLVSTLERAYGPGVNDKGEDSKKWHGKKLLIRASKREGKRYMDVDVSELA